MAIGEDYNISLWRLAPSKKNKEATTVRHRREFASPCSVTGDDHFEGCGIIMAGTFLSLQWGSRPGGPATVGFQQLAFGGVLLDTFVVRSACSSRRYLIPCFYQGRFG